MLGRNKLVLLKGQQRFSRGLNCRYIHHNPVSSPPKYHHGSGFFIHRGIPFVCVLVYSSPMSSVNVVRLDLASAKDESVEFGTNFILDFLCGFSDSRSTAKVEKHASAIASDLSATLWVLDLRCKELFSLGHQAYSKHALDVTGAITIKSSATKFILVGIVSSKLLECSTWRRRPPVDSRSTSSSARTNGNFGITNHAGSKLKPRCICQCLRTSRSDFVSQHTVLQDDCDQQ